MKPQKPPNRRYKKTNPLQDFSQHGAKSDAKILPQTWNENEGNAYLRVLTQRQISALISLVPYLEWRNRYTKAIDLTNDELQAWVDELRLVLMQPTDLCQLIADCLLDPESPANQAVRDIAGTGNGYPANQTPPLSQRDKDLLLGTNPTCDLNKLYGQCYYIVITTGDVISNFIARFEVGSNFSEILNALASSPVINETGAETVTTYAQYMQEAIGENFAAQFSPDLKIELACGLFCLAKDTCSLTIAQVSNYFAERLGASISTPTLMIGILEALIGLPISGEYIVHSLFTLCWKGLELANMFLDGVGDVALSTAILAGAGEPSDDWMLYCTDCDDNWSVTITSTNIPSWLTYQYGTLSGDTFSGVYPTNLSGQNWTALKIDWTFPAVTDLTSIAWRMVTAENLASGSLIFNNDFIISKNNSGVQYAAGNMVRNTTPSQELSLDTSSQPARSGQIQAIIRKASAPQPVFSFELTFNGTGYNPFE